ncbi:TPA: hypothetical protein ACNR1F_004650, partial [Escherichia coli]
VDTHQTASLTSSGVNINTLEMMPVTQSYAGLNVHRQ